MQDTNVAASSLHRLTHNWSRELHLGCKALNPLSFDKVLAHLPARVTQVPALPCMYKEATIWHFAPGGVGATPHTSPTPHLPPLFVEAFQRAMPNVCTGLRVEMRACFWGFPELGSEWTPVGALIYNSLEQFQFWVRLDASGQWTVKVCASIDVHGTEADVQAGLDLLTAAFDEAYGEATRC